MRVVVIGATGHVGGYLVPRLVIGGHKVIAVSRGITKPYHDSAGWDQVQLVALDRTDGDIAGTFAGRIADLKPDVVIDFLCYQRSSAQQLVEALRGRVEILLNCGSIWVHGIATDVPVHEHEARSPFGEYGIGKAEVEQLLLAESARKGGLRSVVLHPGHISGPGWAIVNPAGNFDLDVWRQLSFGEPVLLPNLGLETVHHVHADDVAQAFELALERRHLVAGQSFHVVSERALTLRGFAEAVAAWFGRQPNLRYAPFDEFRDAQADPRHADSTWDHISRSPSMSIDKARRMLEFAPRYTSLQAAAESLAWLQADGQVQLAGSVPTSHHAGGAGWGRVSSPGG